MMLSLSDSGSICDITLVRGLDPELDQQAVSDIRQQIFQPILLDDKPIPGSMMIFRDFWRGDTSNFLFGQTAGAAPDDIPESTQSIDTPDVLSILTAGKIDGNTYTNKYFGLEFTVPGASLSADALKDPRAGMIRLVDATLNSRNRAEAFSLSVIADRISNYPELKSQSAYVGHVSTMVGSRGAKTAHKEFPYIISGTQFMGTILKEPDGVQQEPSHFHGIFSTPMKGYWLTLDITAPTEQQVLKLASSIYFTRH